MTAKLSKVIVMGTALGVFMCTGGIAQAQPWFGTAEDFSYSNGGDLNGHYGTPFAFGNTLYFQYVNFAVNANDGNGGQDSQADTLSFDVDVDPGLYLSFVTVRLFGSYGLTGEDSEVNLTSNWAVEERAGELRSFDIDLTTTPVTFPLTQGPGENLEGSYTGIAEANLSWALPQASAELHVDMLTGLLAEAVAGGNAALNSTFQDIEFEFVFIPEPSTLMLLGLGGLALLRRRR